MADLDAIQDEVFEKLQSLDVAELGECCVQLEIVVPPVKKGKKSAIKALILKYLTSDAVEAADNVEEIFTTLNGTLDEMLEKKTIGGDATTKEVEGKPDEKGGIKVGHDGGGESSTENASAAGNGNDSRSGKVTKTTGVENVATTTTTRVELSRFKEFKLTAGTFGNANTFDYTSLCYQIEDAKELNYTEREILSGVIKSMKQPLQKYCQGKRNWSLQKLMAYLRTYAHVKKSEEVMDEMKAMSQQPDQREADFLLTMSALRDDILAMTKQEENPLDEARVQKNFIHAFAVGLKKDTVRLMLAPVLKQDGLSDDQLMKEVNDAVQADTENRGKTKGGKNAASNSLNVKQQTGNQTSSENALLLKELAKLNGKMTELSGLKDDFKKLECKVNSISGGGNGQGNGDGSAEGQRPPFRFIKCSPCEKEGRYCKHCSLCGKGGHKRKDCKEAAGNE